MNSETYRSGLVYIHDNQVGKIAETENGYIFTYFDAHLHKVDAQAVSLTLALREKPYESKTLFPYFDGLIPEGWLLDIAEKTWKINIRDRMGLLLKCCEDCIGYVSIREIEPPTDEVNS